MRLPLLPETRTLLGRPIKSISTAYFYPDKIDRDHFVAELRNALNHFERDLKHFEGQPHAGFVKTEPKHIESWLEQLMTAMEVETETVEEEVVGRSARPLRDPDDIVKEFVI